ncbi:deoxyribonuclease V [Dehalogenimonas alkenigignens]|uniref:deoxyribonuclease V n=1 Tax=Dehalogenimonas alkenigignens TaxID=1217799 RepID=UPI000D56F1B8|nr:deoxyribonuclease V [Dehalogenimonas alkenigignens]PVV84936.1 deoxyribonuclease V [Dehalogenimonas alkenigignens]
MNINKLHRFDLTRANAIKLQAELAPAIKTVDQPEGNIFLIAGVDVSIGRQGSTGRAAVVVINYPALEIIAESIHEGPAAMPYIPGLLSFRELPLILPALEKLDFEPDLFIVDGHGVAHPRRLGIAAHLGLFIDKPTIGCAKSRLCGKHDEVGWSRGSSADLYEGDEVIGRVIRTREGSKPVYISAGHRIGLEFAASWVLKLTSRFRLPEPVRRAHLTAGRSANLKV